jgi:alanine racemase
MAINERHGNEGRGAAIQVSISALQANLVQTRALAPNKKILVPVKANAYGHGLAAAIKGFADADALAVAILSEALELRQLGWQKPIVILQGLLHRDEVLPALVANCEWVVHSAYQLAFHELLPTDAKIRVWLKLNSGMHRLGFLPAQVADAYAQLQAQTVVQSIILMTHFAEADQPQNETVSRQYRSFENVVARLQQPISLANSGFLLNYPEYAGSLHAEQWIRPGIILYGASPDPSYTLTTLNPAMQFTAKIIAVQQVPAGEHIGYGSNFCASQAMRIGVVSIGYGDGYPRSAPTGTPVAIGTQLTRVVGRVSMDMITIDLTHLPQITIGDTVELWGTQVSVDQVAKLSGTIAYELFCRLTARPVRHLA